MYSLLADLVVAVHVAYVAFIVLGQVAIVVGSGLKWQWIRNPWFRGVHLLLIGIVCLEEAMGWRCPLTIWEHSLRELAGQTVASGSFLGRCLHDLIFVDATWPEKAIQVLHVAFGVLVAQAFIMCPPRMSRKRACSTETPSVSSDGELNKPHTG